MRAAQGVQTGGMLKLTSGEGLASSGARLSSALATGKTSEPDGYVAISAGHGSLGGKTTLRGGQGATNAAGAAAFEGGASRKSTGGSVQILTGSSSSTSSGDLALASEDSILQPASGLQSAESGDVLVRTGDAFGNAANSGNISLQTGSADGGRGGGSLNVGTRQSDSGMTGNDGDGGNIGIFAGDGLSEGAPKPATEWRRNYHRSRRGHFQWGTLIVRAGDGDPGGVANFSAGNKLSSGDVVVRHRRRAVKWPGRYSNRYGQWQALWLDGSWLNIPHRWECDGLW